MGGFSPLSIEETLSKSFSSSDQRIFFGRQIETPEAEAVKGIFRDPVLGGIQIFHLPTRDPNYLLVGESLEDRIVPVMIDYSCMLGMDQRSLQTLPQFFREVRSKLDLQDVVLSTLKGQDLAKYYLQLLLTSKDTTLPKYEIPIVSESAEKYAATERFDLSGYERHTVIFRFDPRYTSNITDIVAASQEILRKTAPDKTFALVEYGHASLESEGKTIHHVQATALVRK
jgi:hypothetical protein